jgi:hypothetical protein
MARGLESNQLAPQPSGQEKSKQPGPRAFGNNGPTKLGLVAIKGKYAWGAPGVRVFYETKRFFPKHAPFSPISRPYKIVNKISLKPMKK